jgi:hypothetical protein
MMPTRKKVELSDPTSEIIQAPSAPGVLSGPLLTYLLLGSVGLSLGATFFLFREVRRLSDANTANRKQQEETAKNLRELGENLRELSEHIATQFAEEGRPAPPKIEEPLPKPEGTKKPKVLDGGPRDDPKRRASAQVVIEDVPEEEVVESDSSCDEDGVCRIKK